MNRERSKIKSKCGSFTYTISIFNLVCRIIPISSISYLLWEWGSPPIWIPSILFLFVCLLMPLVWGIYFGYFGLKVAHQLVHLFSGKNLFKVMFFFMIILGITSQVYILDIAVGIANPSGRIFVYIWYAYWFDVIIQFANSIPIFFLWKCSKIAIE